MYKKRAKGYSAYPMKAFFFDARDGVWIEYLDPVRIYESETADSLMDAIREIDRRTSIEGLYAAGWIAYEASPAFDGKLTVKDCGNEGKDSFRFTLFANRRTAVDLNALIDPKEEATWSVSPFVSRISRDSYLANVSKIREYLAQGETYQINYTFRLEARFSGSAFAWFRSVASRNPGKYLAYLETEHTAICSFSPELFFERRGDLITLKPMKGTIPTPEGNPETACGALRASAKNRAENLMIVDMIRNDVGRVADTGTVEVPSLFDTEVYPTVIQMTSTVQARVRAPLAETLEAIFPCASITGAPKRRSMEIIAELEEDERGIYTGAIGRISPDGSCDFSVAIRTATLDRRAGIMRYGTGSGIVWASSAEDEWEECMAKTAILRETEPFHVFESLLIEEGTAILEKRHLARFERSCAFFGIAGEKGMLAKFWDDTLARLCAQNPHGRCKVKITFDGTTPLLAGFAPAGSMPSPYRIALATSRVDRADPFIGHKTNRRRHVDKALAEASGVDDVILVNTQGELTETTRGNLALEIDGKLYTPPTSSGLLPGVWRESLLETGVIEERTLYPEDLANAKRILMLNSVRRSVECVIA